MADRTHIVRITYRDGKVMDTLQLTREHALSHCETVMTYPSVIRADVWKASKAPPLKTSASQ